MKRTLTAWLQYLESLDPHKIQLGLERVKQVAEKLQLTSFPCPVITVTGTNGKGSCVAFLENIYKAANYRVGAYTSPHLFRFNERVRINSEEISDEILCLALAEIEDVQQNIPLTYFEFTTLAALKIFRDANLDVIILEVGLGGRLDAVNVVASDIAVITTIGIDHTEWLGKDRESIGREKAGIFRANKLAVCGDFDLPKSIIEVASNLSTKIFLINRDFSYQKFTDHWQWRSNQFELLDLPLTKLDCQNAATALMVIHLLQSRLRVDLAAICTGLQRANLTGRFQRIDHFIFDVAHNPHAAQWLSKKLQEENHPGPTLAVVGMLKDKDIHGTLEALRDEVQEWYVGGLEGPRGASGQLLAENLTQIGVKKCYNYRFLREAFAAAQVAHKEGGRIVIFGSFYTVGDCLSRLQWE